VRRLLRGLLSAQAGGSAGPLRRPSRWLLGQQPMRAHLPGSGPVFLAGPKRLTVNSKDFLLSFEFQKFFSLVFLVYLLVLI
jgi:hypothetical protein